jgi:hypothetical protein
VRNQYVGDRFRPVEALRVFVVTVPAHDPAEERRMSARLYLGVCLPAANLRLPHDFGSRCRRKAPERGQSRMMPRSESGLLGRNCFATGLVNIVFQEPGGIRGKSIGFSCCGFYWHRAFLVTGLLSRFMIQTREVYTLARGGAKGGSCF